MKGTLHIAHTLHKPTPSGPFETITIDRLKLAHSHQGSLYVLVCLDHFSCFLIMAPLPNTFPESVAHACSFSYLICPYTTSSVLLNDNTTDFKNQLLHNTNL